MNTIFHGEDIELRLEKSSDINTERYGIYDTNGTRVGGCELRLRNDARMFYTGHISYAVAREHRGHGYAAKACRLLLDRAKAAGMETLYITCEPDNVASRRTCENVGGLLAAENASPPDGTLRINGREGSVCVYRFDLEK